MSSLRHHTPRTARINWLSEHKELWVARGRGIGDLMLLAKKMQADGLYSDKTNVRDIASRLPELLRDTEAMTVQKQNPAKYCYKTELNPRF